MLWMRSQNREDLVQAGVIPDRRWLLVDYYTSPRRAKRERVAYLVEEEMIDMLKCVVKDASKRGLSWEPVP